MCQDSKRTCRTIVFLVKDLFDDVLVGVAIVISELCMVRSHGTKSDMLGRKLHSGNSTTKAGQDELVRLALFWKSHGYETGCPLMCDLLPCDRVVQRAY